LRVSNDGDAFLHIEWATGRRKMPALFQQVAFWGSVRQMHRQLKSWLAEAGLNPKKYGKESLRRTKAIHILNGTGDVEAARLLRSNRRRDIFGSPQKEPT